MCPGGGEMDRCSGVFREQHNPSKINPQNKWSLSYMIISAWESSDTLQSNRCSAIHVRRATHGSAIRVKSHPWQSCLFSCSVQCMSGPCRCSHHLKENAYVCGDHASDDLDMPCYALQFLRLDGLLRFNGRTWLCIYQSIWGRSLTKTHLQFFG